MVALIDQQVALCCFFFLAFFQKVIGQKLKLFSFSEQRNDTKRKKDLIHKTSAVCV